MNPVLRWLFPENEGFEVVTKGSSDFTVLKLCTPPGGEPSFREFCKVESRGPDEMRRSVEDDAQYNCIRISNESHQMYAIVQVGLEVAFYKYSFGLQCISPVMNVRDDVHNVIHYANYVKTNPLPFT
jgi:hypothetical protein